MATHANPAAPWWRGVLPAAGLPRTAAWLLAACLTMWLLRIASDALQGVLTPLLLVGVGALALIAVAVGLSLLRERLLWSLRNRLVLTYLLIGAAPIVLMLTLVSLFAYVVAGQFAIHLVDARMQGELAHLAGDNATRMRRFVERSDDLVSQQRGADATQAPEQEWIYVLAGADRKIHLQPATRSYINGIATDGQGGAVTSKMPLGLPPWAYHLRQREFQGMVLDGSDLYLVAVHQHVLADGREFSLLSSLPIGGSMMEMLADGLGRSAILPLMTGDAGAIGPKRRLSAIADARGGSSARRGPALSRGRESIAGGAEPRGVNLADLRVSFLSTLPATDWDTGAKDNIPIEVDSRPSLLLRQLVGGSLGGIVTTVIRLGLVVLCVVFALIEALALIMALRLSRTVTTSVADLYAATQSIDRGDFGHRIAVTQTDQLAELSQSFNRMSISLQRLLQEQKEKDRLLNEISIAQEVQANLFPRSVVDLPTLELHGVCRPARSVSGDYYDFLMFHEEATKGKGTPLGSGVGIALGDISGKGISAALLMATLHSAVRAYRFASEELVYSDSALQGLLSSKDGKARRADELFESPGRILSLLNRHLYRSTQPEKYATLFLAHYDAATSRMTYSNAGQLPPLVLSRDGAVRRLECGGTVVGLMDGMQYEEESFPMRSGDLMVAYSDGVTEPENDFGEFGEDRLMEVVSRYRDEPLSVISMQVMQALGAWIGAEEQPDDITLVLARQV